MSTDATRGVVAPSKIEAEVRRLVGEQIAALVGAVNTAPACDPRSVDLKTYPGPLRLTCGECKGERLTLVKFGPPKIRVEGTVMHLDSEGVRQCATCGSSDLGLAWIEVNITIPAADGAQ